MRMSNIEVFGFKGALRGMRNPMNSWYKGDSIISHNQCGEEIILGENDLRLMGTLIKAGGEHRKFLRMIHCQFDLEAPRYFWSEFDTYKFNTKNSCSTMHKLLSKEQVITKDLFQYCDLDDDIINAIVLRLEKIRQEYIETNDAKLLERAKQLLPEGFYQKRTIDTNYEELLNIYFQRRNHRLSEWREFCNRIIDLPYFHMFVEMKEGKENDKDSK